jgi:integrase
MVLLAFRHGLRPGEIVDLRWDQFDFKGATLHVRRLKNGAARIGRQDRRSETDAIAGAAKPVTHPRHAYLNRADPGHDRSLRQVAMTHQALPAVSDALLGMHGEKIGHLGFDRMGEQCSRAIAQNLRQSIGKGPWLDE